VVKAVTGHVDPHSAPSKLRLRREKSILVGQCFEPASKDESTLPQPQISRSPIQHSSRAGVSDNIDSV
jgi:hypothetical protein